jgi:hypothetical protein
VLYVAGPVFQRVTIGSLPDIVLLDIFESYQVRTKTGSGGAKFQWDWETLVHVCQRWRYLIFESPIRLNLQLFFSEVSPVAQLLDVWPPFPFVIQFIFNPLDDHEDSFDELITALAHRDRVREIHITRPMGVIWVPIVMEMNESFPELRSLVFDSINEAIPLPTTFLNGSAPCLQELTLRSITFPSLPLLLSSTGDLTSLRLEDIPDSGYILPETMARCLSALPKLESLSITFDPSAPHFDRPHQQSNRPVPPPARSVLPALTSLEFSGVAGYLELLAARIDAPPLNQFKISFFHQPESRYFQLLDDILFDLAFDIPQIARFLGHVEWFRPSTLTLNFNPPYRASLCLSPSTTSYSASPHSGSWNIQRTSFCRQIVAITQICSQILPCRFSVQLLVVESDRCCLLPPCPSDTDMDPTIWLQLFHSFTSVQSLQISDRLEPFIAAALQGLTAEAAAEVFPSLHSLSIVGKKSDEAAQEGIQSYIIARQQSSHPVALSTPEL